MSSPTIVNVQSTGLQVAQEQTLGVLPGSPAWFVMEPNSYKSYGAQIKSQARQPISRNRQRRRGAIVDLDSGVGYESDFTYSQLLAFIDGFMYCSFLGGTAFNTNAVITAVTGTQYTVTAGGALADGRLIYARGFAVAGNNGLKVLAGGSTGTALKTSGLTAETPPTNVMIEEAGVQGASGDITLTVSGGVITLGSTVLNFTTLPWVVGQVIWLGGGTSATRFASNPTTDAFFRVKSIAANAVVLEKKGAGTWITDAGAGKTIQILYGRFLKNVRTDDGSYVERSYQFEQLYPNLTNPYSYAKGNVCSEMTLSMTLGNLAKLEYGFVGTDTPVPTNSRATNAATPYQPVATAAYNTTSQLPRLRALNSDETSLGLDGTYWKNLTVKIMNNITPEKALGVLGPVAMPNGIFSVDYDMELMFVHDDVLAAARTYRQLALDLAFVNDDGGVFFDAPSFSLSKSQLDFPVNQLVKIKTTGESWQDPTLGTSLSVSLIPYVPH